MARYLAHNCPRCNGYFGIILREPGRNTPLQAINGHCLKCGSRLAWIVIRGNTPAQFTKIRFKRLANLYYPVRIIRRSAIRPARWQFPSSRFGR